MRFARVPGGTHALGWRYSGLLTPPMVAAIEACSSLDAMLDAFSPARDVALPTFEIAVEAIAFSDLMGDVYELGVMSLGEVCDVVDTRLGRDNLRLPTEDELEAACGGSLFAWGTTVPDGVPYGSETTFDQHQLPSPRGLVLKHDTYAPELARAAFLLGDGGRSVCGGDPWPVPWLSLCPSFRLSDRDVQDCLDETLGSSWVRPVRLS